MTDRSPAVQPEQLDMGLLSYLVGLNFNRSVKEALAARGHAVRPGLGFLIQHLIVQPRTATELAQLMGVSQQAASKSVKELLALGYVEHLPSPSDARWRLVQLSEAGWDLIGATRTLRGEVAADMLDGLDEKHIASARKVLLHCLERLGGMEAVRTRRVQDGAERC